MPASRPAFVLRMWRARRDSNPLDLQVRNLTLYPLSYGRAAGSGGEGGIRTLGAGYPTQRFSKPPH